MTRDEWTQLATAVNGMWGNGKADDAVRSMTASLAGLVRAETEKAQPAAAPVSSRASGDVERIAAQAAAAQTAIRSRQEENVRPAAAVKESSTQSSGDSVASTVLKTAGMATGVGPLVTGLIKLFGGGGEEKAAPPPLIPYSMPDSVSADAGLSADRSLVQIAYGQGGQARSTAAAPAAQKGPQIQVNVQAMDSRSFLDHSDEIAQAVRNAMLRSHSLNDVVSEL